MRLPVSPLLFLIITILAGCGASYSSFQKTYTFHSASGQPDYSNLDYWAAHPWKWDPSDSTPAPLRNEPRDSTVDVFFLYPTSFTSNKFAGAANAAIDDAAINAKTDYTSILYQASVFNQHARVFSPRYRQAHIGNFFTKDTSFAKAAFDTAYSDITRAFEYYLQHFNNGRPIIIAAHSQGSMMAERLLKDFFENTTLKNKLIVAYIAGWPVPKNYFTSLPICRDSLQTGCICSWRTFRSGYTPAYLANENGNADVTNPLNWRSDSVYAARTLNKGSVLRKFNSIYRHTNDAWIKNGLLYVHRPKFPWSFLYLSKNYHVGDINLFYLNIRHNVEQRIGMFWKY